MGICGGWLVTKGGNLVRSGDVSMGDGWLLRVVILWGLGGYHSNIVGMGGYHGDVVGGYNSDIVRMYGYHGDIVGGYHGDIVGDG